jgi:hypothetical protein
MVTVAVVVVPQWLPVLAQGYRLTVIGCAGDGSDPSVNLSCHGHADGAPLEIPVTTMVARTDRAGRIAV